MDGEVALELVSRRRLAYRAEGHDVAFVRLDQPRVPFEIEAWRAPLTLHARAADLDLAPERLLRGSHQRRHGFGVVRARAADLEPDGDIVRHPALFARSVGLPALRRSADVAVGMIRALRLMARCFMRRTDAPSGYHACREAHVVARRAGRGALSEDADHQPHHGDIRTARTAHLASVVAGRAGRPRRRGCGGSGLCRRSCGAGSADAAGEPPRIVDGQSASPATRRRVTPSRASAAAPGGTSLSWPPDLIVAVRPLVQGRPDRAARLRPRDRLLRRLAQPSLRAFLSRARRPASGASTWR